MIEILGNKNKFVYFELSLDFVKEKKTIGLDGNSFNDLQGFYILKRVFCHTVLSVRDIPLKSM